MTNCPFSRKCGMRYFHIFRSQIQKHHNSQIIDLDHFEADEIYIGLKESTTKDYAVTKRQIRRFLLKTGRGTEIKNPFLVVVSKYQDQKTGKKIRRAVRLENLKGITIKEEMDKFSRLWNGLKIVETDEFRSYSFLNQFKNLKHYRCNHSKLEYVNPYNNATTNNAENFNCQIRRYCAIYRFFSLKFSELYLNEFIFRIENKIDLKGFVSILALN